MFVGEVAEVGEEVTANRDLPKKDIFRGETGVVESVTCIDSEEYYFLRLADGRHIGPSVVSCWDRS